MITGYQPFGCPAYAHVPKQNRKKLDSRTCKCIMVGYMEGTKAYQLWDPSTRSVVTSHDVIFDE